MQTKHYIVENIAEFSEHTEAVKNLQTYLDYIEGIFPVIEEVFGQKWKGNHIHIILNNSKKGAGYRCPNGIHTAYFRIRNEAIQTKNYPENLWGCLLHETSHAFIHPIIHGKIGGQNSLNGDCSDEPFLRSFLALVYLKLKEKGKISEDLCEEFLAHLEKEIKENEDRRLYNCYKTMFLENPLNFHKFLERLKLSDKPLIRKDSFQQDLAEAKKILKS